MRMGIVEAMDDMLPRNALWIDEENIGLNTDFYQLTMTAAYYVHGTHEEPVTFEYFMHTLPAERNFVVFSGLEQVLHFVSILNFKSDIVREYIKTLPCFSHIPPAFFDDYLKNLKFTGDVYSVPEGTIIFAREPVLAIRAPRGQAQMLETYLLSVLNYQSLCATKAARIRLAAGKDRYLLEMGSRRAHSPLAGVYNGRASYIGGFNGTSNLLSTFCEPEIPPLGTMAHSYIMRFGPEGEKEAFKSFLRAFPSSALLIDTYDTLGSGIQNAIQAVDELAAEEGFDRASFAGVRIDSGDLFEQAVRVREILDSRGFEKAKLMLTGDLNEYRIAELEEKFQRHWERTGQRMGELVYGVGTAQSTSDDSPNMPGVYKLSEQDVRDHCPRYVFKHSPQKQNYPGFKQIYRFYDENGIWERDRLTRFDEDPPPGGLPLLRPYFLKGNSLAEDSSQLAQLRARTWANIHSLPPALRDWKVQPPEYFNQRLEVSEAIRTDMERELKVRQPV